MGLSSIQFDIKDFVMYSSQNIKLTELTDKRLLNVSRNGEEKSTLLKQESSEQSR